MTAAYAAVIFLERLLPLRSTELFSLMCEGVWCYPALMACEHQQG
jgi:hypothetical protein